MLVRSTSVLGSSLILLAAVLPGCDAKLGGGERVAPGGDTLLSGSYTYDRPEVGSIAGCTATLVGPRLVVTASHCVDYTSRTTPGRYGTFEIRRFAGDSQRYTVERIAAYAGGVGDDDVALLRLSTEVPADIATPAGIARTNPSSGTAVSIFGYGCQRRGTSGTWAKQRLDVTWGPDSANLCPGDSGGPTIAPDGTVLRVNSGYYLDWAGTDIFGSVPVVYDRMVRTASGWGDTFGAGSPTPGDDADPSPGDAGADSDAGVPPPPPPPPPGDGPCDRATCEEATALAGCGWCDATARGMRVGSYGEALEACATGYRLNPEDCGALARSTCGPWSGISAYTCRRGATQFVRCDEGSAPEFLTCPSGYSCAPGSTERFCYW